MSVFRSAALAVVIAASGGLPAPVAAQTAAPKVTTAQAIKNQANDLCTKAKNKGEIRPDQMLACVVGTSEKIALEQKAKANNTLREANKTIDNARKSTETLKNRSDNTNSLNACFDKMDAASPADLAAAKSKAGVTNIDTTTAKDVCAKLPTK